MSSRLLIFAEGAGAGRFDPLGQVRPACCLRNGAWTVAERWIELVKPTTIVAAVRPMLAALVREQTAWTVNTLDRSPNPPDDVWLITGVPSPIDADFWQPDSLPPSFRGGDGVDSVVRLPGAVWAKCEDRFRPWIEAGGTGEPPAAIATTETVGRLVGAAGLWDLINHLTDQLCFDWKLWCRVRGPGRGVVDQHPSAVVIAPDSVWVGDGVRIGPHTVVDASDGPVILDRGVVIEPFTRLEGPACIGPYSRLVGGKVSGGAAIGPVCKIGGEVEASIVQGFSNKVHEGFFGHGIIGEWVNLGALTTNSDLKNTYGTVRVERGGRLVETGALKVGSYLSDHTKTGIGTLLPTGAVLGTAVNVIAGGLVPKSIPPFVWGGGGHYTEHRLDPMLRTAHKTVERRATLRRELGMAASMTPAEDDVLRAVFDRSAAARQAFLQTAG